MREDNIQGFKEHNECSYNPHKIEIKGKMARLKSEIEERGDCMDNKSIEELLDEIPIFGWCFNNKQKYWEDYKREILRRFKELETVYEDYINYREKYEELEAEQLMCGEDKCIYYPLRSGNCGKEVEQNFSCPHPEVKEKVFEYIELYCKEKE